MRKRVLPFLMALLAGCSTVEPGTVVVRAQVCGDVTDAERYTVIHSGRYWLTPCRDHYTLPTREQRAVWTRDISERSVSDESITFAAVDGQSVNVDVGVSYSLAVEDESIVKMILTYGPALEQTIHSRVRDATRHALNMCAAENDLKVQDIYGASKVTLFDCAEKRVKGEFNANGLVISRLTLNSEVRLPAQIKEAMERSQKATQDADRARREIEQAEAEGQKKLATARAEAEAIRLRAEAEAEANRIITSSLTPEVLEMRRLEVQLESARRWNGSLPTTMLGNQPPFLLLDLQER